MAKILCPNCSTEVVDVKDVAPLHRVISTSPTGWKRTAGIVCGCEVCSSVFWVKPADLGTVGEVAFAENEEYTRESLS